MGCFSFICKECNTSIRSDCFHGEMVKLFLLKDDEIIEEMEGEYSCYGTVLIDGTDEQTHCRDYRKWEMDWPKVVQLMRRAQGTWKLPDLNTYPEIPVFSSIYDIDESKAVLKAYLGKVEEWKKTNNDGRGYWHNPRPGNGIAAVHTACFRDRPTTASESDPDQGSGRIRKKHRNKINE